MRFPLNGGAVPSRGAGLASRLRAIAVAVLALLLGAGCASLGEAGLDRPGAERELVYEGGGDWIALATAERAHEPNDHPVELGRGELVSMLGSVNATLGADRGRGLLSDRAGKELPLLTPATLEKLGKPLADAFSRATASQDVLVQVRQARPRQLVRWLNESRVTALRLFHRDGRLHVIAGAVDIAANRDASSSGGGTAKSGGYQAPGARITHRVPMGSRARPAESTAALTSALSAGIGPEGRADWLVLDRRQARAAARGDGARDPEARRPDRPAAARDAGAAAAEEARPAADAQRGGATADAPLPDSLDAADRQRLRELRELRRRDLISESVYESLVRDVLEMEAPAAD